MERLFFFFFVSLHLFHSLVFIPLICFFLHCIALCGDGECVAEIGENCLSCAKDCTAADCGMSIIFPFFCFIFSFSFFFLVINYIQDCAAILNVGVVNPVPLVQRTAAHVVRITFFFFAFALAILSFRIS